MSHDELATFAGGCFWCMVKPFDQYDGVKEVVSGYTGGHSDNPSYREVCRGETGHTEAVQITFDPDIIPYEKLVEIYWQVSDPTDLGGQFVDRGDSYRPAIFYHNDQQKEIAEQSKKKLDQSGRFDRPVLTPIEKATDFYPAEDYHQDFYKTNPEHYERYSRGSGRLDFQDEYWG